MSQYVVPNSSHTPQSAKQAMIRATVRGQHVPLAHSSGTLAAIPSGGTTYHLASIPSGGSFSFNPGHLLSQGLDHMLHGGSVTTHPDPMGEGFLDTIKSWFTKPFSSAASNVARHAGVSTSIGKHFETGLATGQWSNFLNSFQGRR